MTCKEPTPISPVPTPQFQSRQQNGSTSNSSTSANQDNSSESSNAFVDQTAAIALKNSVGSRLPEALLPPSLPLSSKISKPHQKTAQSTGTSETLVTKSSVAKTVPQTAQTCHQQQNLSMGTASNNAFANDDEDQKQLFEEHLRYCNGYYNDRDRASEIEPAPKSVKAYLQVPTHYFPWYVFRHLLSMSTMFTILL